MLQIIFRRLISLVFVLFSLTFITFMVGHLAPGDPILLMLGNRFDPVQYAQLRHQYGFDQPLIVQYWNYITGLLHGNLGMSFQFRGRSVAEILAPGIGVSLQLGLIALAASTLVGIPAGVVASLNHNRFSDRAIMLVMLGLFSIPSFVLIPVLRAINFMAYDRGLP